MSFTLTIEPEWNVIKKIKESIANDDSLKGQTKDFMEQTLVTAIELLENSLKYSDSESGHPVEFTFQVENGRSRIRVRNYSKNPTTKQALLAVIETIHRGDPFDLYVKRLEKLKDYPDGYSRMGLYRIAYEGEYQLSAEIQNETVTITAERNLENV